MQINNQGLGKHSFGSKSTNKNSRNGSSGSQVGSYQANAEALAR